MSDKRAQSKPSIAYPIIILVIIAGGVFMVMRSSFTGGQWAISLDAIAAEPVRYEGKEVRLVGHIKHGSSALATSNGKPETRFAIVDSAGNELKIRYPRTPPDAFKEGRECVVEGRLAADGVLDCKKLTVKCPSKYQTEDEGQQENPEYYQQKYSSPQRPNS